MNALAAVKEANRLLSVTDAPIFKNVNVYPTMATDVLNISESVNVNYSYTIFNMNGIIVGSGEAQNMISISHLTEGTYILHLKGKDLKGVKKFIKI